MGANDAAFQARVQSLFEYDRLIRSHTIYEATAIEGVIENIIAWHFCPEEEKHLSFTALMFVRAEIPFSKKIDILERLLKDHYRDILDDIPGIINDLNSLRRFRNKFAHNELIIEEDKLEVIPTGIWLRSLNRDGVVVEEFISSEDADKRIAAAYNLRWYMFYIMLEVEIRVVGGEHNQHKGFLEAIKQGLPNKLLAQPAQEQAPPAQAPKG
jgi:hypothetical protein